MTVRADMSAGYRAAFYVCGLPKGAGALFDPNPATAQNDPTSPAGASARSRLRVVTTRSVPPASYSLEIHAYYQDPSGVNIQAPPIGGGVNPPGATLTVDASGNSALTPLNFNPGVGGQNCSTVPPGFAPNPTQTPLSTDVALYPSLSDPNPVAGELETLTAVLRVRGQPAPGVLIHTYWYFPNEIRRCDIVTGSDGSGSCSLVIQRTIPNQTVQIQLILVYNGQQHVFTTSFVTR